MATFNKINQLTEDLAVGVHNLASDQIVVALTTAANAPVATNEVLADLTQITYTNCSSRVLTVTSSAQTSGSYVLKLQDLVLTASGGTVGPFSCVVIYNDTPTSPADPLIGWYVYPGGDITLQSGETFTIDFDATNGVINIS